MSVVPPSHIAETIKFCHVCNIAERIRKTSQVKSKEKILERYYESFSKHRSNFREQKGISSQTPEDGSTSFYCVLRCLMPQEDRARKAYDLQKTTLGNCYIKVLQIPDDSRDAEKLRARSFFGKFEDYAEIVHEVLKVRCKEENSNLNLKEVHDMLDQIATEDRRSTEMVLTRLAEKASAYEQKWFIRLLLKSMGLGLGEQRIFNVLHPQAKDLYQRCGNLEKVCNLMADNSIPEVSVLQNQMLNLNSVIEPFQHIRPMLCERFPGNIEDIMAKDVLYLERKMDGERFQLHFLDGRFKYISRNGVDYTHCFGSTFDQGNFTPLLKNIWPIGLKSVILDGEMMVWDTQTERFREKGENTDVKHLSSYPNWRPCFVVYDLLYLNGKSLLDMTYVQRNFKMQEIKEDKSILEKMKPKKITSMEEFMDLFQAAIDAKAEGVVLKKQSSKYLPGVRFGGGWYKDKADYIKGLTEEFDLLIIGGFYNRERTYIESFLVGVLEEKPNEHFEVYSVGKVPNVIRQRSNLNNVLKPHWHPVNREPPPLWYHYVANNAEGRPDVWIEPQKSCILQIKAADLSPSGAFSLQKCLHFPRITAWRNDKVWNECMALSEYKDLFKGQFGLKKLNKRESRPEDFTENRKRQKETPAQKRKLGIMSYEKRFKGDEIEKESDLLDGFYVCVLSGSMEHNKNVESLKTLAARNGAIVVENPLPNEPKCINIAGDDSYRLNILKKSKRYDMVSVKWFLNVCEKQVLKLRAKDMVCMTKVLEEQFAKKPDDENEDNDDSDDDFESLETQKIPDEDLGISQKDDYMVYSVATLKEMLEDIDLEQQMNEVDESFKEDLERHLFADYLPKIFYGSVGAFLSKKSIWSDMAKLMFLLRGGIVVNDLKDLQLRDLSSKDVYVFLDSSDCDKDKIETFSCSEKEYLLKNKVNVLNVNWIIHSSDASQKLDFCEYSFANWEK